MGQALQVSTPEEGARALATRLLADAVRDAKRGDVASRVWLLSDPVARSLADALGVSRSAVLRAVVESTAAGARDG